MSADKFFGRTPIRVRERGACDVPISELRGLALSPTILSSLGTLIEFRYAGQNVKLSTGGVVGHLPLSDSHILIIEPKFPISHMSRMVWASRVNIVHAAPINRFYELAKKENYSLDIMLKLFAKQLSELLVEGVHRSYNRRERISIPRPHIDFRRSAQRFWSRGIATSAIVSTFDLSADGIANSLIKTAVRVGLQHSVKSEMLKMETEIFREADRAFEIVPLLYAIPDQRDLAAASKSIPSFRPSYFKALPLAFEIITGSSLLLDRHNGGLVGSSFLINLEIVFEAYVRNVLREKFSKKKCDIDVLDGNKKKWSRNLFADTDRHIIKPDLIFRYKGNVTAIADAKYTARSKEEHRYQVLAHSLAIGCRTAILIYPCNENVSPGLRRVGTTVAAISDVTLYEYGMSLEDDLDKVEEELADVLGPLIAVTEKAVAA